MAEAKKVEKIKKSESKKVASKTTKTTKKVTAEKVEKKESSKTKMKVEKVPSNVVVKKKDKEVVSKIKIPTVVVEEKETKTKAKKTTASKATKTKTTTTNKKADSTKKLNTEKVEENNKLIEKKEETIVERIKSFLRKIVEMQKEAKEEFEEEANAIKEGVKVKKAKAKKAKKSEGELAFEKEKYLLEYYDLPYRYDETVVRILAQTPKRLFVYWDISDSDRQKYITTFGENFFNETYPIILLYNENKNYVKEIVVNDFANSWYIDIDDPKTKYSVQLGRKFKNKPQIINIAKMVEERIDLQNDYLPLVNSNKIEAPNDRILFESFKSLIKFRNVKTGQEFEKDIGIFEEKISKAYDVASFKETFKEMNTYDGMLGEKFDLDNPGSGSLSSSFK